MKANGVMACIACLLATSATAAPPGTRLGPETIAAGGAIIISTQPEVARFGDGVFAVAALEHWDDWRLRVFGANGAPLTLSQPLSYDAAVIPLRAALAADRSGRTLAAFSSKRRGAGSPQKIYARFFGRDGLPGGAPFTVSAYHGVYVDNDYPAVASAPTGGFLVSWARNKATGAGLEIAVRAYDAAGKAQSPPLGISSLVGSEEMAQPGWNSWPAETCALAGGGYVLAWTSANWMTGQSRTRVLRLTAKGVATGTPIELGAGSAPALACDPAGGFAVAQSTYGATGAPDTIVVQRFRRSGAANGAALRLERPASVVDDLAIDRTGSIALAWGRWRGGSGDAQDLLLDLYGPDNFALASEILVDLSDNGPQSGGRVAVDAAGEWVYAWDEQGSGWEHTTMFQRFAGAP